MRAEVRSLRSEVRKFPRQQQALDSAAARHAVAEQARGEDTGVFRDEQIACAQEAWQIADVGVSDAAVRAIEHQEPRRSARGCRLRDKLGGK